MCIRDRYAATTTGTSTGAVNCMHDSMTGAGGGVAMVNMLLGAVSYTHLRAHETVLDIVCRLLLEKKNKEKKTKKKNRHVYIQAEQEATRKGHHDDRSATT